MKSSIHLSTIAAAAGILLATHAVAQVSADPRAGMPPPMTAQPDAATRTITGTVRQWLINPNGDVDGLLLDDGTQVAMPPHLSSALTQAVKVKDKVKVVGAGASGSSLVRAASIMNVSSGRSVVDQPPQPGMAPPAPRDPGSLTAMTVDGKVTRLLSGPMGEVNGAVVDNGTIVRFSPGAQALGSIGTLKVGGQLYAMGYGTRNDYGSALEATRLGTTAQNAQDVFTPPQVAARPVPPAPQPQPQR